MPVAPNAAFGRKGRYRMFENFFASLLAVIVPVLFAFLQQWLDLLGSAAPGV
jgi:hypothetical protein